MTDEEYLEWTEIVFQQESKRENDEFWRSGGESDAQEGGWGRR